MARILLAVDFEVEARWLEAIIRGGHEIVDRVIGADALIASVARTRPDLALVQAGPETLTERSLRACDACQVRTVALTASNAERRHAARLGIVDRVEIDAAWSEVEELLKRSPAAPGADLPLLDPGAGQRQPAPKAETRRARREREREQVAAVPVAAAPVAVAEPPRPAAATLGRVITVWGPHGAPGATTVAINLAAAFAGQGLRTILIDADTYGGAVAPSLGLVEEAPGLAAACRLAGAESLTVSEIDRVSATAGKQAPFRVLGGITNPSRWIELGRDRLAATLDTCRAAADVIVVDVGFNLETDEELASDFAVPRRNAATLIALEHSDSVVTVCDASPVGITRFLRARMALTDRLGVDGPALHTVVNRVRSGVESAGQIRDALRRFGGIEHSHFLPYAERAIERSLTALQPAIEAAPRSRFTRAMRALAEATAVVQ